ncbi:hypothetical protein JW897_07455 [Chromobacterium alkanivorans]|uniref:hypothetical protein n=1 Tax=Chromobacterium alkanivorans TaxID=1071719 RepID=UPI00196754CF|nr:hypothetical protein [Chromobacterium alkanivorans]MBN3003573.1 hypothetical protein [Chromobacterium alkanivorans]
MILSKKTLEFLREIINEKSEYRSGTKLVKFFNDLGFNDTYGQGFPSRWIFTEDRLTKINGTPTLDQCIKNTFAPVNFVDRIHALDLLINEFNQYLAFDKWKIIRREADITFQRLEKIEVNNNKPKDLENEFLSREFTDIELTALHLENAITNVLQHRIKEIEKCFNSGSPLAVILLAGSALEGILLGVAIQHPRQFNSTKSSPKDSHSKVKPFYEWSLSSLIDVAKELNLIQHDTHKFSHSLRDFRNYIHPFEQLSSGFSPREHTAKICLQVLRAAIHEIGENLSNI